MYFLHHKQVKSVKKNYKQEIKLKTKQWIGMRQLSQVSS